MLITNIKPDKTYGFILVDGKLTPHIYYGKIKVKNKFGKAKFLTYIYNVKKEMSNINLYQVYVKI